MMMHAHQSSDALVFRLEGFLDFTTTQLFEEKCVELMQKNHQDQIVFNFEKLKFVGSTGINHFVRVLKEFNSLPKKPVFCQIPIEFEKIIRALETKKNPFLFVATENEAIEYLRANPPVVVSSPILKLKAKKSKRSTAGKKKK